MFCRFIAVSAILLGITLPASASNYKTAVDPLAAAADRMKIKDFAGAREAALKSSGSEARAFLIGISCVRLELWEEAASQLAASAASYPLLGDYALYYQAVALAKLGRPDQALVPLFKALKQYPESRLARPALLLYGDTLAAGAHPREALQSYTTFIERYPSGSDSLSALLNSALCREKLGDPAAAAAILRGIWLSDPASTAAVKAGQELQRISGAGTKVEPYTSAELFKRSGTLYDLGRYAKAAKAYGELPLGGATGEFAAKVRLKTGQSQLKARHYQDAEETLRGVSQGSGGTSAIEATYWLAKALDKNGKPEQAYEIYLRLAQAPGGGAVAQDALLDAAYLKRYQKKWSEALPLFKRFLASRPSPRSSGVVIWEAAWASYQSHDYPGATGYLKKLAEREELREKSLYWLGKSQLATGDLKGAQLSFATLADEYPFGYYAFISDRWRDIGAFPSPPANLAEALPMPAGFQREKALINLGLLDEAARELSLARKNKNALGIARLYLEMDNYNGALHAVAKEQSKRGEKESAPAWGVNYPLAYQGVVAKNASATAVPESLIYSIMRAESSYFPAALSPVGAVGLMQIMPATAESISKGSSARLTQPDLNIRLGAKHLKDLLEIYDGNVPLAVAAYNAGAGNVKRWRKGYAGLPQDEFIESIPFRETREYVKRVVSTMELYRRLYRLPAIKN